MLRWHVGLRSAPMFPMSKKLLDDIICKRAFLRSLLADTQKRKHIRLLQRCRPRPSPKNLKHLTCSRALLLCHARLQPKLKSPLCQNILFFTGNRDFRCPSGKTQNTLTFAVPACCPILVRHPNTRNPWNSSQNQAQSKRARL